MFSISFVIGWPLGPDLSGKSNSNEREFAQKGLGNLSDFHAGSTSKTAWDSQQRPAGLVACLSRLRTHIVGWPQVRPMHMQKSRFAKGLLAPAATMLRGARSRPAENYFDRAAPGPSPQSARSERFPSTCHP